MSEPERPPLGPGPWEGEPDREEWQSAEGYQCRIVRNDFAGVLCGYVALPDGHPWRGRGILDVPAVIHGGCTFSQDVNGVWWIGFDCGHAFDYQPGIVATVRSVGGARDLFDGWEYRTIDYVRSEVRSLAQQIKLAAEMRVFMTEEADA